MPSLLRALSNHPIHKDLGLLLIRIGIGTITLVFHGYDKIMGGPELWAGVGGAMGDLGIGLSPTLWGFMAAFAEFGCSILIILGVLFRPATAMLAFTMFIAMLHHVNMPADHPMAGWAGGAHAMELMVVYVGLMLAGPGRYAFRLIPSNKLPKN